MTNALKVGVHTVAVAEVEYLWFRPKGGWFADVLAERFEIVFRMKPDARDIADLCEEVTRADMKLIDEYLRGSLVPVQPWPN